MWKWVIGVPLGIIALLFIVGSINANDPATKEKWRAQDAIKLCWEGQGRKSLEPATARFVASACEKMERDYEARYGRKP